MPRALLSVARQKTLIKWIKIKSSIGFKPLLGTHSVQFGVGGTVTQLEWAQLEWAQLEWAQLPGEGGEHRPRREGWNDESKAGIFPSHLALPAALPQRALPLWDACGNSQQHFIIPVFVLFDVAAGLLLQVKVLVSTSGFEPWDRLGSLDRKSVV